jgi:hypothetical protein
MKTRDLTCLSALLLVTETDSDLHIRHIYWYWYWLSGLIFFPSFLRRTVQDQTLPFSQHRHRI